MTRTRVRLPRPEELATRLGGVEGLLTATKWERAAIVYAYTEVGDIGRGRWYKPQPPKMHIREFAAKGYAGLTTNKSVSRYRDAWVTAINNGWAVPVEPGMSVILPDEEFPQWPYGVLGGGEVTVEVRDEEVVDMNAYRDDEEKSRTTSNRSYSHRPREARVLTHLDNAATALRRLAELASEDLDDEMRSILLERLADIQTQMIEVLTALGAVSA